MPGVGKSVGIRSSPIDTYTIGHVFNSSGLQQSIPSGHPSFGPVGHIKQYIIIPSVSAPNWKTKVVTDQGTKGKSFIHYQQMFSSCSIFLILSGQRKRMSFIITGNTTVWLNEK